MDPGPPDTKRPRLSTGPSWSAGGAHHGVSLLHPTPSPTNSQVPHHPPSSTQYPQPSPRPYSRPAGPGDPHHQPPPHPPPPQHPHSHPPPHAHSHAPPPPPPHSQQHPPPPPPQQQPVDDRRHHEPDRYPPMQEHRQPPHSPAHPTFAGYPPREPLVKPDPGEDTLPQLRRPQSMGNGPDSMTPGTPHSAIPPQGYGDDRRHTSFDNGPPPPHMYRQPSYPPPTPLPPPSYDYGQSYGGSHGELPYPIHVTSAQGKRKAQRASQACDSCRQLKAKCDELKPCKSCKEKKVECKYREAVPKQQDKVAADILDTLMFLKHEFNNFNQRMSNMEHAMRRVAPSLDIQPQQMMRMEEDRAVSPDSPVPVVDDNYSSSPGDTMTATQAPIGTMEARNIARNMEDEAELEPGPHVRPGVPTIPLGHTTLAALLLKWRSIESLVRRYLDAEKVKFVDEFPIRQEERRGLLRLWGRGEGLDSSRSDREAMHDLGLLEIHDDYSDSGAPSPADCWGAISGSPGPIESGVSVSASRHLDFSPNTVWKCVESYEENIQNMHPLIIPVELKAMVRLFLDGIVQSKKAAKNSGPAVATFVAPTVVGTQQAETGSKRKRSERSPAPEGQEVPAAISMKQVRPTFQRSINNALVLLVLALGKICLHKTTKIPDVVPVSEPAQGSPVVHNGHPASPVQGSQGSPPSYASNSHSSGLPSPKDGAERSGSSRRPSFQGGGMKQGTSLKRNMDVIPGLDYFAYATDILGGQLAGTSIRHIHAYILAGLYHGQLGRVMESYAYIKEAGWALQIKMRPSLDRFRKMQDHEPFGLNSVTEKSDNQLVFAFWTCLQLESDIIAELPLPQSHILAYEEMMPYPNINLARQLGFSDRVLRSYLAQLYLRKSLNVIHQMLYNPENPQPLQAQDGTPAGTIVEYIQKSLDIRFVPPEFKFKLSDPPAQDILSARLRAKYWGANVITYRPFIRQILEHNHKTLLGPKAGEPGDYRDNLAQQGVEDPLSPGGITQEVIDNAVRGIRALIESTRAFHGVPDKRFIITNVFGTAHAQWGNLLTLAAAFRDPTLTKFIDEQTLRELFSKTIAFFRLIAQPSSALSIDMRILEGVEHELWGKHLSVDPMDAHAGSSFSSTTSSGPQQPPVNSISGPPGPPGGPPPLSGPPLHPGMHTPGTPVEGHPGPLPQLPPMRHHPS
ncbi:hypothetical protein B0T14DRAFT_570023 [Immersiella caudata]|uniref:Zn(2)-C6 fungal-type domain-containing protein n=1 Tax=Immersiella caudata TaxID=314043 RepID=A0AA39WES0_9PEZI|nr:hypothetical protein B0T14DRAFT_570023 [Immersiella caudata]